MTCPTCDRPQADESSHATLGPGESCECGIVLPDDGADEGRPAFDTAPTVDSI